MNSNQWVAAGILVVALSVVAFSAWWLRLYWNEDECLADYLAIPAATFSIFIALVSGIALFTTRDRSPEEQAAQVERAWAERRAALPPGAVVLKDESADWWTIQVEGKKYLAHWVYKNGRQWELTPVD